MSDPSPQTIDAFVSRWKSSGGHERGSGQLFLTELCDLLGLPHPDAPQADTARNDYVFERAIPRTQKDGTQTTVFLDLYKAGHFVLETKQGVNPQRDKHDADQLTLPAANAPRTAAGHGTRDTKAWDKALERAYEQARRYIRDLPAEEPIPPFLIVCDVGYVFELYADFSGTRGTYTPFPVAGQHRIFLDDLADDKKRDLLRTVFTNPHSLDPSKHAAKVTREVSTALARLATSLEKQRHDPQVIALFLQRCLFTLFAEDIGLLPEKSFEHLLRRLKDNHHAFSQFVTSLWKEMATGTDFSTVIQGESIVKIPHFNGGLFENPTALPLDGEQITLLLHAATKDWSEVEPAIFGTLLERALDPRDRHKLGAHYTPRSYVERLVQPTLLQPLRAQWDAAKTAAALHHAEAILAEEEADQCETGVSPVGLTKKTADALGKKIATAERKARAERLAATKAVTDFHHQLCSTRVLDPACGSGNFLYVAMARMKELEAEVLDLLAEIAPNDTLTAEMDKFKVRPDQFLGLEINERATAIAQLVLWIGYFQWHKKSTGKADTNDRPLLPKQSTITCRDAVLDYDDKIPLKDEDDKFVTIWDGHTTKPHPVTGKEVPDETARKPVFEYVNPRRTTWPEADYIVGNPPFLGNKRMREGLGSGYVEALRKAFKKHKPNSWDFVMFWWHQAAKLVQAKKATQFGFITTNSIHQTFNRGCLEPFLNNDKKPISLAFAVPDHPWIDSADGAAVRIAMTVGSLGRTLGALIRVTKEDALTIEDHQVTTDVRVGRIFSNLKIGPDTLSCSQLKANQNIAFTGMYPLGQGFLVRHHQREAYSSNDQLCQEVLKPFVIARDLTQISRKALIIDFYPLSKEDAESRHPKLFQKVATEVKPERDQNPVRERRENWWLFTRPIPPLRHALKTLPRFIVVPRTAKFFSFQFVSSDTIPDTSVVAIASGRAEHLGVLSATPHLQWAVYSGGRLGMGNDSRYQHNTTFKPFPFPDLPDGPLKEKIRDLGERLDAHRKARQAAHPELTLTGMYNVLEKLRREEPLSAKEQTIHEQGLVTLLKQIHDELDQAVLEAYGWEDLGSADNPVRTQASPPAEVDKIVHPPHLPLADRLARGDEDLEQVLLQRLVDLNHQRAAEEARGHIRYLRPEFQDPDYGKKVAQKQQERLALPAEVQALVPAVTEKLSWPKTTVERVAVLKQLLQSLPPDPAVLSPALKGNNTPKRRADLQDLLDTLASLGQLENTSAA